MSKLTATDTTPDTLVDTPDVTVGRSGYTVVVFTLHSEVAREWVEENVGIPEWAWLGTSAFAVDHRYAGQLAEGMIDSGLIVR